MPKTSSKAQTAQEKALAMYQEFIALAKPLEQTASMFLLTDRRTDARYCECHIRGSSLLAIGTVDVPLDPEEQGEYRANREIVENHDAFVVMKEDAKQGRCFSNIVAEFSSDGSDPRPIKIIGGQHRFEAIREALEAGVDEYHGVKVYVMLTMEQRLDVQLISNTNIAVSADLLDRMRETFRGPELRNWCQAAGLLDDGQDFADNRTRSNVLSVHLATSFIVNYHLGKVVMEKDFETTSTIPELCKRGKRDESWEAVLSKHKTLWKDANLKLAATEFAALIRAQRAAFEARITGRNDMAEKATSPAVLAAWAYVAGLLQQNDVRLKRHYALRERTGVDPLNAKALAKARHRTDPENYRGLGLRSDPKERGRLVELFYLQAEKGEGITPKAIEVAMAKY